MPIFFGLFIHLWMHHFASKHKISNIHLSLYACRLNMILAFWIVIYANFCIFIIAHLLMFLYVISLSAFTCAWNYTECLEMASVLVFFKHLGDIFIFIKLHFKTHKSNKIDYKPEEIMQCISSPYNKITSFLGFFFIRLRSPPAKSTDRSAGVIYHPLQCRRIFLTHSCQFLSHFGSHSLFLQ